MAVHARRFALTLLLFAAALLAPRPVAAQDTAVTTTTHTEEDDDSDFPWGLLGLLGLAGLIPRRKKEEIHVHEREVHTRPVPPRDDRPGTPPPPRA